ncbi:MAG: hypothetical protein GYB31_08675 [Bacteroidetes bacterium]|nr:hypothetical protein [Bacteroidota bacterium]
MNRDGKVFAEVFEDNRPIVFIKITSVKLTDKLFDSYLEDVEKLWRKDERYFLIMDFSDVSFPKLKYIRKQADWIKFREKEILTYCRGIAFIVNRSIVRMILKTVFVLQESPVPYMVFSSVEEAEEYGKSLLGLDVPA